jgi:hypothetical protein
MSEYLQIIKSYWWLITGIGCVITWIINAVIGYLNYRQKGNEYLDRQRNRRFWRWFGIGVGVSILVHLLSNPSEHQEVSQEVYSGKETDRK